MKVHQLDVAIPLHLKSQLKKGPPLAGGEGESESGDTMPFVMLTRKGNKQQVRIYVWYRYCINKENPFTLLKVTLCDF